MPPRQSAPGALADPTKAGSIAERQAISGNTAPLPTTSQRPRLNRETFRTSRLLEFCSRKELVAQTGHEVEAWPLVLMKELVDNGIDACEEADIAPDIAIKVSTATGEIEVNDNGPGIPSDVSVRSEPACGVWRDRAV